MDKPPYAEWLKQADYDMETAEVLLRGGRCVHAVFMCHLSVEKALKGLHQAKLNTAPPKTHNLFLLMERIGCRPDQEMLRFLGRLNEAHIPSRYPVDIAGAQAEFTDDVAAEFLRMGRKAVRWINGLF